MNGRKWLTVVSLVGLLTLSAACTAAAEPTSTPTAGSNATVQIGANGSGLPITDRTTQGSAEYAPMSSAQSAYYQQSYGVQGTGIWVNGTGRVTVKPDLVILSMGVEARAKTVAQARDQAATAMTQVRKALTDNGIKDEDIQTQYFNIQPEYVWNDFDKRQEITGYVVTNFITAKVRDMESVGVLIDEVADAGGDLVRINNISFTVENANTYIEQAREAAVKDALAKAKQFAELTGSTLGKLTYISEVGSSIPVYRDYADAKMMAEGAAAPTTPISPGTMDISMSVQAVFSIQ